MTEENSRDRVVARPRPCGSCPYRTSVASGIWHEDEYAKLSSYDEETFAQPEAVFMCHTDADRYACSGWLGHADPSRLLAVRIGVISGQVDPSCLDYTTDVELFPSGAAAAAHGVRDILEPSERASASIEKIVRGRAAAGNPVTFS